MKKITLKSAIEYSKDFNSINKLAKTLNCYIRIESPSRFIEFNKREKNNLLFYRTHHKTINFLVYGRASILDFEANVFLFMQLKDLLYKNLDNLIHL